MPTAKRNPELDDLTEKLRGAKETANAEDAGDRDRADLKLLEQKVVAEKLKAKRPAQPDKKPGSVDAKLDKALKDSFPGSDPVSFLEAAPIKKGDRPLSTVPNEEPEDKK